MKRLPLLSRWPARVLVLLSLSVGSCGPTAGQQATLVAVSVNATLTSEAGRLPSPPTIAPTVTAPPPAQPTIPPQFTGQLLTRQAPSDLSEQGYAVATKVANWKRTKYDPLTKNLFGWCDNPQPRIDADGGKTRFFFNQNTYHVTFTSGDNSASRWCAPYGTYYDFNASIKALLVDADPSASYGLVFRLYHQSYSSMIGFWLTADGKYYVGSDDEHGNYINLQGLTDASGLQPNGEWNKLTVDAEGSVFTFFINDLFQSQLTYDSGSTAKGGIGVSVDVQNPRRSVDVQFSDYEIREP